MAIKYSWVVPVYKDAALADDFCREFRKVHQEFLAVSSIEHWVELLFVNDGSPDNAQQTLEEVSRRYPFVRVVELSRNFGQHIALICGYQQAIGEWIGMLNIDQQDPPREIPKLIRALQSSQADFALSVRPQRVTSWTSTLSSKLFNHLLNWASGHSLPVHAGTLRLMNRRFCEALLSLPERSPFLPGMEAWIGFKKVFVPIEHQARTQGTSSYNFSKRLQMALHSFVSFSDVPLKATMGLGLAVAALGFAMTAYLVISKIFFVDYRPGYTSTIAVTVLFSGAQMVMLGISGLYLARVLQETQKRPLYLVRSKTGWHTRGHERDLDSPPHVLN